MVLVSLSSCELNNLETFNSENTELIKHTTDDSMDTCMTGVMTIYVHFLPNDLMTPTGISDSLRYVSYKSRLEDSLSFKPTNWEFCIGEELQDIGTIDIRTMFTIEFEMDTRTYFMDHKGKLLYNGHIYKGSESQMNYIRSGGKASE